MPSIARVIAMVLVGLLAFAAACGDDGVSPSSTPTAAGSPTATPRARTDEIAICVDAVGVDEGLEPVAQQVVADAAREGAGRAVVVEIGCPEPAFISERAVSMLETRGRFVTEPSYYRAFVYVLPPGAVEDLEWRLSTEEIICYGDDCASVTQGLYLQPKDLCVDDLLQTAVTAVLGRGGPDDWPVFVPPYFDPPPAFGVTPAPTPTPCY